MLSSVIREEGKALENRLSDGLKVVDYPAGKVVLRSGLQEPGSLARSMFPADCHPVATGGS